MTKPVASLPQKWISAIGPIDGLDIVAWDLNCPPPRGGDIDYVCVPYQPDKNQISAISTASKAKTIQLLSAGFEDVVPYLPTGASLANAKDVHSAATAEQALTLTLAMQRGVPQWIENHRNQHWMPMTFSPGIGGKNVLVIGYGDIGRAIAQRVHAFEPASITAVASQEREGDNLVDRVYGIGSLHRLLGDQDIIIIVVPLNDTTKHLVDSKFIADMKPGALLVNVGRGKVVKTEALIEPCTDGVIRVGLDVTDPEPLPDGHPLWTTPGVLIAPHVGGLGDIFWQRAEKMLRHQLHRVAIGQEPDYIVYTEPKG